MQDGEVTSIQCSNCGFCLKDDEGELLTDTQDIPDWIETNKLPAVISGVFTSVSKVGGHMNCITGFSKTGIHEFIVNDPYGYALSGYTRFSPEDSTGVHYGEKFYTKDSKGSLWVMLIKQS